MLAVKINIHQFEYDIHSLIKAFYPETDVKVFVVGEKDERSDGDYPEVDLRMDGRSIVISVNSLGQVTQKSTSFERNMDLTGGEDRPVYKNRLKQLIYSTFSELQGRRLPWGTLTGIRPTKIPMQLITRGKNREEILDHMKTTYLVSDEKAALAYDIAKRELGVLSGIDTKNGYSLYIGIPFCPTTCLYCSFTSFPIRSWRNRVDEYIGALEKEIDFVAKNFSDKQLDSVYIGGGTPTTLEPDQFERLIGKLRASLNWDHVKEFTVEAGRADSITEEKLRTLLKLGVTRISVNPQTMNEETLKFIGRKATAAQTVEAYKLARSVGFDNINMDIILGLPGETEEDVTRTIEIIKELKPDSLTVHSLAVKRASALSQWIEKNGMSAINNTDDMMDIAAKGALKMGLSPYYLYRQKNMSGNLENVGYASDGKYGIYNILIMEEVQSIVALGAGTVTKRVFNLDRGDGVSGSLQDQRIERCDNVKDVALYIDEINEMIDRKRQLFSD